MTLRNPFKKKPEKKNSGPVRPAPVPYATFNTAPDPTPYTAPTPRVDDCGPSHSATPPSHGHSTSHDSGGHSSHSSYDSGSHSSGSYDSGSSGCDSGGGF